MGLHFAGKSAGQLDADNTWTGVNTHEKGIIVGTSTINSIPNVGIALKSIDASGGSINIIPGSTADGMNLVIHPTGSDFLQVDFRQAAQVRSQVNYVHIGEVTASLIVAPDVNRPQTDRIFSATSTGIQINRAVTTPVDFDEQVGFYGGAVLDGNMVINAGGAIKQKHGLSPSVYNAISVQGELQPDFVVGDSNVENMTFVCSAERPRVKNPLTNRHKDLALLTDLTPEYIGAVSLDDVSPSGRACCLRSYKNLSTLNNGGTIAIDGQTMTLRGAVNSSFNSFVLDFTEFNKIVKDWENQELAARFYIFLVSSGTLQETMQIKYTGLDGITVLKDAYYYNACKDASTRSIPICLLQVDVVPLLSNVLVTRIAAF